MSRFQLPSSTVSPTSTPAVPSTRYSSEVDSDDLDTLPYPAELPRNDFLAPDFDPQTYLSTLRNRHQTLEDLRSDLRQRSQLLTKELLDLVNGNYEEFLSLGSDLKGGEEKVEGVRVGLLGFRRELEGVRRGIKERVDEVASSVRERKQVRLDIALGRSLLELDERLKELEVSLSVKLGTEADGDDLDDEDEEDEEQSEDVQLRRLRRHVYQYVLITRMMERIGGNHPFLIAQGSRLERVCSTILLDLAAALRHARGAKKPDTVLAIVKLYGDLGAEEEGIKVLKSG